MTSRRTDTVRRGQRSADSTDALAASSTGQPLAAGSGGSGSVNGSSRRPARSRAIPEMHQASGRLPSTVMSKTVSTRSPSASMIGVPGLARRLVAQDQQARAVVGETELLARAQHAVGHHAAQRSRGDLEAPGQDGPDRRQRHPVPHLEVGGAAHDLERLRPAAVDDGEADLVGALDRADLEHPADHHVAQPLADVLDRLDDETEVVQRVAQHPDVVGERGEITEPAERSAHGGLSRCGAGRR